jgi:hypothetical protein
MCGLVFFLFGVVLFFVLCSLFCVVLFCVFCLLDFMGARRVCCVSHLGQGALMASSQSPALRLGYRGEAIAWQMGSSSGVF